jgi:hypothetical protein
MPRPRPLHVADNPGDQAGLMRAADIPGVRCQTSSLLGHDSERGAREACGADKAITDAIDAHVDDEKRHDDGDDGLIGMLAPAS